MARASTVPLPDGSRGYWRSGPSALRTSGSFLTRCSGGRRYCRKSWMEEMKTEDPDPQRLVMAGEDRTGQVVEEFLTGLATVALPLRLGRIMTLFRNPRRVAMGASHAQGPAQLANRFVTLPVVDEILDVDHRP